MKKVQASKYGLFDRWKRKGKEGKKNVKVKSKKKGLFRVRWMNFLFIEANALVDKPNSISINSPYR